jgi:hypothetical protein
MVIQPRRVIHEAVDVVQEAAVSGFLTRTKLQFGKLDSIANFAGTGGHVLEEQIIWDNYRPSRIQLYHGFKRQSAILHSPNVIAARLSQRTG